MKLGFALKKPKKTGALAAGNGAGSSAFGPASDKKEETSREFVTSFDPHAVALDASGHAKRALVIPLLRANAWAADKATEKSADERAADALLADAAQRQAGASSADGTADALVIPMATGGEQQPQEPQLTPQREDPDDAHTRAVRARLFNTEAQQQQPPRKPTAPILRQNAVPGMDALADANDKYRLDVSLRPDELDVHSEAYALVPVEDFGAALLRGMGWKGSVDADAKSAEPKPRHKLLGLGATARPPMPGDAKNKHRAKPSSSRVDNTPRESGLNHTESSRRSEKDEGGSGRSTERDRRRSPSRDDRRSRRDGERSIRNRPREERHGTSSSTKSSRRSRSRSRERGERRRDDDRRKRSRSRDSRRDDDDRKRSSRR